ncbi:hypothetical protein D0864_02431 [Hortaea werneckii]|uniref:CENP-V/GFA domain-containing protein n=1 Tax=Hortaea werneckii TaxID=91943 RepID=A0A3M7GWV5_HORWE|nr:hypothetical protein D0864_02431 [Hortaea werneckii]
MPEFPWPPATGEEATYDLHCHCYDLHCHCGTIRYTITISPPLYSEHSAQGDQYPAVECACSWCQRNGEICVHPLSKDVISTHGGDHRGEYYFGKTIAPHWFCKTCASTLGGDMGPLMKEMGMEERMTINLTPRFKLRMLKDFDRTTLKINPVTAMKEAQPKYENYIDRLYAESNEN